MGATEQRILQTHFGAFLKMRRDQWDVTQREVLHYFPGWTQANYSRLESGAIAPAFNQLLPLYTACLRAGIHWNASDRHQFITLAQARIASKQTHPDHHSEHEWAELRYQMTNVDFFPEEPIEPITHWMPPKPLLAETRHLIGRNDWHASLIHAIQTSTPRKLIILQGPVGIGKSSELHRLIQHFIHASNPAYHVIWIPLLPAERSAGPESSLDLVLGNILAESGAPPVSPEMASWEKRQRLVLAHLEQSTRPVVILIDNAESILTEEGLLSTCWEEFLTHFLRHQHQATLVLATKEWPGWPGRDRLFVHETTVPPLDLSTSVSLLQQLGLASVPLQHLQEAYTRVGGIPLCLEWVAALVQDPLSLDDWQSFSGSSTPEQRPEVELTTRLIHLIAEPTLLRGHFATKLQPLLTRILEKRLSPEAQKLLHHLAVCNIPLGKTALQTLCEHPKAIRELRNASLLVAYSHRVQVLPMVADVVVQGLAAEQMDELEKQVICALKRWKKEGSMNSSEAGNVIAELVVLLIKHHRLLHAAQQLLPYHSLISNSGHLPQLARLMQEVMSEFDWRAVPETECGGLLLHDTLAPFLGKRIDDKERVTAYQDILKAASAQQVKLQPSIEAYVIGSIVEPATSQLCFEEVQALFEASSVRLASLQPTNETLKEYLHELHAWLFGRWSDFAEEQGEKQLAKTLREQAISFYKQCTTLLLKNESVTPLKTHLLKTRLSSFSNDLAYYLAREGEFEEALQAVEHGVVLKEEGYLDFGTLSASCGEKSEILVKLGRFQEALLFDEKALTEVQRLANTGHTPSQEEAWMYLANRGRLYLRLGMIDEAEQLLREALPQIHPRRRIYRVFAKNALDEIEQWRKTQSPHHQLDWRWVERYRTLASFDSFWWLASAGPFNHAEQRQPHLHYPALDIEEVRSRISGLLQLDREILEEEPNAIVSRLYHDTIEEELWFLYLIEATYEGKNERFWEYNVRLNPVPTTEEMSYAFSRVEEMIQSGLSQPEVREASGRLLHLMQQQLGLSVNLSSTERNTPKTPQDSNTSLSQSKQKISVQATRRFFEAILTRGGYEGWQVIIDSNANSPRVEQGLRHLYIPENKLSVAQIKHYLSHELAGHVARCIAGEHSLLGLLGIHSRNSLETEEGLAVYYDRQREFQDGQMYDDTSIWSGTLATGLASGVLTAPQKFLSLYTFFEAFYLLYQLLKRPHLNVQKAQRIASRYALSVCLRTYRGVPDLELAGICYTKDVHYLRGLWKIERAVTEDTTVLDRLAVGVVAVGRLPDLHELGIVATPQSFRKLASDPDLDTYILAFEEAEKPPLQQA